MRLMFIDTYFLNLASDRQAAVLPANEMLGLNICVT